MLATMTPLIVNSLGSHLRRSLVLEPTDEVDAIITLSALSRQAEAFRLAERTLVNPLARMNCSLNSPAFGIGVPVDLGLGLNIGRAKLSQIVDGDVSVEMNYQSQHRSYCQLLFDEAGGEET